jgi:thioredoxin-related protein
MLRLALALLLVLPLQAALLKSLDEAKAAAAKEEKDIYLVFTSLKVSGACVQLEKRILSQKSFREVVGEKFILVHLDVPVELTPGMISPLASNRILAQKFAVDSYPSAFFLDAKGRVFAQEKGFLTGGPEEYSARLLKQARERDDQSSALQAAYKKEGLDRAKAIVAVLKESPKGANPEIYSAHMAELARLDPDDSLGFQKQRLAEQGFQDLDRALDEVFHKDSYDEVVKLVEAYVIEFQPQGSLLQKALFPKLAALNHGKQVEAAIKAAQEVIAVDASSSYGKFAAQILARLKSE